jgi:virginiamycin B lyase
VVVGVFLVCCASAAATPPVTEFSAGIPAGSGPDVIARGPDNAMWFSEYSSDRIGRVAADGSITQYPSTGSLSPGAHPSGVVTGPDGNIWFSEFGTGRLGELNPTTGQLIGEYPLPAGASSQPEGIVVGPDGALWFTERGAGQVGRLDLSTASPGTSNGITEYPVGTQVGNTSTQPVDLVDGPDGALWVTLFGTGAVDRIDPTAVSPGTLSGVIDYPLPGPGSAPEGISVGSDNAIWIADEGAGQLVRVDTTTVLTDPSDAITDTAIGAAPLWISSAAGGALWATDNAASELLQYDIPSATTTVLGSAQGVTGDATGDAQDVAGNLWFTEFNANKVGEVALSQQPVSITPPVISPSTATVGQTVSCSTGTWTNSPTAYTYQWQLDGHALAGETGSAHVIGSAEAGHQLTCQVTATNNALGSGTATSAPITPSQPPSETLTITTSGTGTGFVSGSAVCFKSSAASTTCHATFPYGTVVSLTGNPTGSTAFIGWLSLGNSSCVIGTCSVTMNGNQTVTAFFEAPATLTVKVDGSGQGFVSIKNLSPAKLGVKNPVQCVKAPTGPHTCPGTYNYDSELALTAVPTAKFGSRFVGWSGGCSGTASCGVFLNRNVTITATFTYDAGVHVNAIEITQGVQTTELPTRTTVGGYFQNYSGVPISSNGPGSAPVTVKLAQDHATVVRVYVNTALPRYGQPVPTMRLTAYRNGRMLAPGPIGPDQTPSTYAVPVGPLGSTPSQLAAQRVGALTRVCIKPGFCTLGHTGTYTFTLPWGWAEGNVYFEADTNTDPNVFVSGCQDTDCFDRGIYLDGVHFNPVSYANVYPIALTVNGVGPQGYTTTNPPPDPQWAITQDVVPFPIYISSYGQVVNATTAVTGCDGLTQGKQTNAQFSQAVYLARDAALLNFVTTWASQNNTSKSIYPFGVLSPVGAASSTCPNAGGFSGGLTTGGTTLYSSQPASVASDDRPITGMGHEFHHGIGLPHAGVQCNSGTIGTAETLTGSTTVGSTSLTLTAQPSGLQIGQPISGPGVVGGAEIVTISGTTVTMTAAATSTNSNASYSFTTNAPQAGSSWPPTFIASSGVPADGLFDGVGLVGLDNIANSPYTVRGPASTTAPTAQVYDLMSYCTGGSDRFGWISVRNWNYDVGFNAPGLTQAADLASANPPFSTVPPASLSAASTLAVTSVYDIGSGRTLLTTVAPDASAATPRSPNATYSLTARNAAGQVVARAGTTATLTHVDPGGGHAGGSLILIRGKIAAAGVREVDVLQNGRPIGRDHATAHAPTAAFARLSAGTVVGGQRGAVLRWRSHDADGGSLEVTVRYSADGGRTWKSIYSGADTGSARVPGDLLSRSRNARLRLYVSDGFNEAIVTSPRLISPGVAPSVTITSPRSSLRLSASAALNLAGSAYDDTGTRLTGRSLVWRSGRQVLGRGTQITTVALPAGRHRVTLTGRDRSGRTGSASVTITILAAPPVLTLFKAPHRISAKARSVKLRLATLAAAPLRIGRARALVGRRPKTVRVTVKPGRKTLTLQLVLRSGRYSTRVTISILR